MNAARFVLVAALMITLDANAVWAHSFPAQETPSAGQTLPNSPSEISIKFDAPIEHLFAQLQVIGANGTNLATGTPEIGSDGYTMSVKVPPLAPGDYQVKWAVVCIDTHHTNGSYNFTVSGSHS
jgi:methionine-rich copper-binding protein CopC